MGEPISAVLTLENTFMKLAASVHCKVSVETFARHVFGILDLFYSSRLTVTRARPLDVNFYLPRTGRSGDRALWYNWVTEVITTAKAEWPQALMTIQRAIQRIPLDLSGAGTYEYGGSLTNTSSTAIFD